MKIDPDFNFWTINLPEATRGIEETEVENSKKEEESSFDVLMELMLHNPCSNR